MQGQGQVGTQKDPNERCGTDKLRDTTVDMKDLKKAGNKIKRASFQFQANEEFQKDSEQGKI